jgi:uncharacterized membrane protein YagU involved in acid resistance
MTASSRAVIWRASITGGLTGAVVEMIPVIPLQAMLGVGPLRLFQSIAFAIEGRAAFSGGVRSALFGALLHTLISLVFATFYVSTATRWDFLIRKPVMAGILLGFFSYAVMNFLILPLTPIGFHPPHSQLVLFESVLVHILAFGIPIALVASWILKRYGN